MLALLRRRPPEARDVQAGRVALADDVADGAALAGGVEALEDEQHAARPAGPALRVELLLQRREPLRELRLLLLCRRLVVLEAGGGSGVDAVEAAGLQPVAHALRHPREANHAQGCARGPHSRVRRHPGGRPADAHLRGPPARRRAAPRRRLLHRHLPAHRAVAALGGTARGLRVPRRRARDLPPHRAGRHRARVRRRRARSAARATPTRPRSPTSTPTSTPRSPGSPSTPAARSAPRATAPAATSRSAPRCARRSAPPRCWYATGLHDGKLGKDPDAGSLARAAEIEGELLAIWGIRDPHTPLAGAR